MNTSLIDTISGLRFVKGVGDAGGHTACIMSAARILAGEASVDDSRNDSCARVCSVVRRFAIGVNDWRGWRNDKERTEALLPLVPLLLDTHADDKSIVVKRAFILADVAIHVFAPAALDARGFKEHAAKLRGLLAIVDAKTARDAAAYAAYAAYAADAADAAAYAAYAASAAAAADAAAADAYAAAYAADAAAYAADAADAAAREKIKRALIDALVRICKVTS
jgi:hypothetical protein